ncbi:MAG: hypothetical protein QOH70_3435 [Blastocatellia bacterium]|jgi:outer membrane murein-binding lipoprotein Lpp|nr:hypothetical protein [Blastocatellia bacterium]
MRPMSEDRTRDFPDNRSFEERVFARFDAMDRRLGAMESRFDARFDALDSRIQSLDLRVQALESKALDTKPIWERALAEILEVKQGVQDLNRKIDVLNQDVLQVRADQRGVAKRMDALESSLQ